MLESGSYVAFLSEGTSLSLAKGEVDPAHPDWTNSYDLDCRDFADAETRELLELEDPIPCGGDLYDDDPNADNVDRLHETWIPQAGYRVLHLDDITTWRGEAVITAEGDLQIGFHHRMPGGADFRFIFAVDPDFQPTTCDPDGSGGVTTKPLDGDWIASWSDELRNISNLSDDEQLAYAHMADYADDGKLFFLNSQSYQVNPRQVADFWSLPDQFEAGAARAKISEELLIQRRSVWAFPRVYAQVDDPTGSEDFSPFSNLDLWWCELEEGADPASSSCDPTSQYSDMDDLEDQVLTTAGKTYDELERAFRPGNVDPVFRFRPMTHLNRWRSPDGVPAGFDGWGEMHYNYVVFSGDSLLEAGGSAEGAFSLSFEAVDSFSQVFIHGTFSNRQDPTGSVGHRGSPGDQGRRERRRSLLPAVISARPGWRRPPT